MEKLKRNDRNLVLHLYLKDAITKLTRLQVFDHSKGEHFYILIDKQKIRMKYKTYGIKQKKTFLGKYWVKIKDITRYEKI